MTSDAKELDLRRYIGEWNHRATLQSMDLNMDGFLLLRVQMGPVSTCLCMTTRADGSGKQTFNVCGVSLLKTTVALMARGIDIKASQ